MKCQKSETVVGKFYLGKIEEDSRDRYLLSSVGESIRSRDVIRTFTLVDSDVNGLVSGSKLRHCVWVKDVKGYAETLSVKRLQMYWMTKCCGRIPIRNRKVMI